MSEIASNDDVLLRVATDEDLQAVDEIAILCWTPIFQSYVTMMGQECYDTVRPDPELSWQERKTGQIRRHFERFPDWTWVLEKNSVVVGFVTFRLVNEQSTGIIGNNGIHPEHAGHGLGKFMYRHVLDFFRQQGMSYANVGTGLDDAHLPARRAYEGVGFDRAVPAVEYWQDLRQNNPGSTPE